MTIFYFTILFWCSALTYLVERAERSDERGVRLFVGEVGVRGHPRDDGHVKEGRQLGRRLTGWNIKNTEQESAEIKF